MLRELPADQVEAYARVFEYWHGAESWMDAAATCLEARAVKP